MVECGVLHPGFKRRYTVIECGRGHSPELLGRAVKQGGEQEQRDMNSRVWTARQKMALKAMGFPIWEGETPEVLASQGSMDHPGDAVPAPAHETADQGHAWQALEGEVSACERCGLCRGRSRAVPGSGNRNAALMLIGEAPGAEEDRQGLPFVGRAGQLLTRMLAVIQIQREEVYITNTVKCRPPENRKPTPTEQAACRPYLERQIHLVRPKLLVALGGVAAQALLQTEQTIGRLRGEMHAYRLAGMSESLPLIATYHPAFLLRSPQYKKDARADLDRIRAFLDGVS